jgi:toxin ParE1/3/4
MTAYVLTSGAEADLRAIVRYSRSTWGEAQARRYLGALTDAIGRLAAGTPSARRLDEIHPGLLVLHNQHHFIFGVVQLGEPMLVVAILHERMDLMARMTGRLTPP